MHHGPREVTRQPHGVDRPGEHPERQEQLVGVEREDEAARAARRVVPEECRGRELAPALDGHIVHDVVHVDEESTADNAGREGDRAGGGQGRAARDRRGDEMTSGAHALGRRVSLTTPVSPP